MYSLKDIMKKLGVIGLGYVGLPLAVQAAEKGLIVTGIDLDQEIINKVNSRTTPYVNDARFEKALSRVEQKYLKATNNYKELSDVDTIVICVPTPTYNNVPDFSYIANATKEAAPYMRTGQLIVLESTVNPGVTRDLILPIIEDTTGLKIGEDIFLAHCPERIDPGNAVFYVGNLNRVVGGITEQCTKKAAEFYQTIIDAEIVPLGSTEEAEFVKSWENSHRNVMIALANSAALICDGMGMDINRVLMGLQSKVDQFGLNLAKPGIGPGGHCIPEDIHYVIKKARQSGIDTRFLDDAAELNEKMPRYAVFKLSEIVNNNGERLKDLKVALLGLSYKPDVADLRRSPSIEAGYELMRVSKSVVVFDPYITNPKDEIKGAEVATNLDEALINADAIFIGTAHKVFLDELSISKLKNSKVRYILDGRNALSNLDFKNTKILYTGIGR